MTGELDALLIRSLPELNDAANRLDTLDNEIGRAIDAEVDAWAKRNGWMGTGDFHGDGPTWLAPPGWMVPNDSDENAFLYFDVDVTGAEPGNQWHLADYVVGGAQRIGFWLATDAVGKPAFKRLFRESDLAGGLPLHGAEFFLPLTLDREELAKAIENDALSDALGPVRRTLDLLLALAERLEPLKAAIVATGNT